MNWKFVFAPIPLIFILAYAFFAFPHLGDFGFHSTYKGDGEYPSGVAFLVNLIPLPQGLTVFAFALLVAVVLPYILIYEITKNATASWVYLYGSNVATLLVSLYFVPQALIHVFMLASILFPPFLAVFILFGSSIHNSWFAAFLVVGAYLWVREYCR